MLFSGRDMPTGQMCCDDILCRMCAVDARSVPPVPRVWGTPAALHQHNVQSLCAV